MKLGLPPNAMAKAGTLALAAVLSTTPLSFPTALPAAAAESKRVVGEISGSGLVQCMDCCPPRARPSVFLLSSVLPSSCPMLCLPSVICTALAARLVPDPLCLPSVVRTARVPC